ncbi:IS5 family transposase [Streptomyces cellulosae]
MEDELWALIEPLLPPWPRKAPGPKPVDDRLCLQGILYVLYNDVSWQLLPLELGFGSGQTCWRRLGRWHEAGVFDQLHRLLLSELHAAGDLDWSRACVDASHIRAKKGARPLAPSPVDRGKTGSKHHLICDGKGTPFKVITTAANVNDVTQTWPWSTGSRRWPAGSAVHGTAPTPCSATRGTTAIHRAAREDPHRTPGTTSCALPRQSSRDDHVSTVSLRRLSVT